jgi:hypothetical protein
VPDEYCLGAQAAAAAAAAAWSSLSALLGAHGDATLGRLAHVLKHTSGSDRLIQPGGRLAHRLHGSHLLLFLHLQEKIVWIK